MSSAPQLYKLKEFSTAEIAAGQTVRIPLESLPTERNGRPLHLAAIRLVAGVDATGDATTMATAMPGELLLSAFENVRFNVGHHNFIDGMNGTDLDFVRQYIRDEAPFAPADVADATASSETEVTLTIDCGRPAASGKKRYDGVIPCAAFVGRGNEQNQLKFRVATAFGETAPGGSFAGVTCDGLASLTAYAYLVPLDRVRVPTTWSRRRYESVDTTRMVIDTKHLGAVEAVYLRTLVAGAPNHANMTQLKLRQDGQIVFDNLTSVELGGANIAIRNYPDTSGQSPEAVAFVTSHPDANRTLMVDADRLELNYIDGDSNTRLDAIVISQGVRTLESHNAFAIAAGAPTDPRNNKRTDERLVRGRVAAATGKKASAASPQLDAELTWAGMPYSFSKMLHGKT